MHGDTRGDPHADRPVRRCVGDFSPLHTDELYAVRAGYPGVMAHGMLAMGAAERVLADWGAESG